MGLIEKTVPSCAWVASQAQHVKISHDKIPEYTKFILGQYPVITEMGAKDHYLSKDAGETAAYILALDSINFGSGYFHIAKECGVELE